MENGDKGEKKGDWILKNEIVSFIFFFLISNSKSGENLANIITNSDIADSSAYRNYIIWMQPLQITTWDKI